MKITKNIILLLLATSLPGAGFAQGFCFSKGNNQNRMYDYNNYPMPAIGFTPQGYYGYPYGSAQTHSRYGNEMTDAPSSRQDTGQYRNVWGLQK